MKKLLNICSLFAGLAFLASCDSDAEKTVLSGFDKAALTATQSSVVVSDENKNNLVLQLVWTLDELAVSNPSYGVSATQRTDVLQVDVTNTFAAPKETTISTLSKSYTGADLNALATKLGLATGKESSVFFRVKSTISANTETLYSNVVTVKVTPVEFSDGTKGFIFLPSKSSSFTDFSNRLYSEANDGKYSGFVKAAQWENFRIYTTNDANATIYGSKPNSLYTLDASDSKWDIWYDEGGYFFVEANLNTLTWSKTAVTSIAVVGDFNSWSTTANPLTYDADSKVWTVTCNISNIGWGLKFIVNEDWNWTYTDTNGDGLLHKGSNPNIVPASTGTYKITVNLSNPAKFSYKLEKQ